MYSEYLYKTCSGDPRASVVSENHPLPLTTQQTIEIRTILSVLASLFVLIPFCYVPGAFIVFLVKEKTCKSKHLQLVSGVNLSSYWLATYLWDMTLYFVLTVIAMLVFLAYGKEAAVVFVGTAESFVCTMALIFGYGLSVLPFSYLISRSFEYVQVDVTTAGKTLDSIILSLCSNHSSSQIAVIGVVFVTGFVAGRWIQWLVLPVKPVDLVLTVAYLSQCLFHHELLRNDRGVGRATTTTISDLACLQHR